MTSNRKSNLYRHRKRAKKVTKALSVLLGLPESQVKKDLTEETALLAYKVLLDPWDQRVKTELVLSASPARQDS